MAHSVETMAYVGDTPWHRLGEPPRVSRRPNFLREYPNEKYLLT